MMNPVPLLLFLACLREPCFEQTSCNDSQTGFAGCIAENCKKVLKPCLIKTAQDIAEEMKIQDPSAPTEDLLQQAVFFLETDFHTLLNCLGKMSESPVNSIMCVLEAFLFDPQWQNNNHVPFMSSDLGYISCWIKTSIIRTISCVDAYDLDTLVALQKHNNGYQEMLNCFLKTFPYWGTKCIPLAMRIYASQTADSLKEMEDCVIMWNNMQMKCMHQTWDLYGSNITVPIEAKDFFICTINQMISATAAC